MGIDNRIIQQCYEVTQLRYRQLAAQQERDWPEALRLIEAEKEHARTCPTCAGLTFCESGEYKTWVRTG